MGRIRRLWVTLAALGLCSLGVVAPLGAGATWKQQHFAITFLETEFAPSTALPAYYKAIASLNFTVAEGWGEGRPISVVNANLNAAATAGLDSIVSGYSPTGSQPNPVPLTNSTNSHLMGFMVKDEPKVSDFADLKNWMAELTTTHPGKLRLITLLPTCSAMGPAGCAGACATPRSKNFSSLQRSPQATPLRLIRLQFVTHLFLRTSVS